MLMKILEQLRRALPKNFIHPLPVQDLEDRVCVKEVFAFILCVIFGHKSSFVLLNSTIRPKLLHITLDRIDAH